MQGRLGLNVHRDQWPTAPALKAQEAAGFAWVQVHSPPRAMLADRGRCLRHARALRTVLDTSGLRLVLHGPDDLSGGTPAHDAALAGLIEYALEARAELVVYHGLNYVEPGRAPAERASLRRAAARAQRAGVVIAVENLCPVHPGPPRLCHDPRAIRDFVRAVDSPAVGMLLDVGHAHVTASLRRGDLTATIDTVIDDVVLFHIHDNFGARRHDLGAPGIDPLKLDLHLPPGEGNLPWDAVAQRLHAHKAPLMLEVERSHIRSLPQLAADALGRRAATAVA